MKKNLFLLFTLCCCSFIAVAQKQFKTTNISTKPVNNDGQVINSEFTKELDVKLKDYQPNKTASAIKTLRTLNLNDSLPVRLKVTKSKGKTPALIEGRVQMSDALNLEQKTFAYMEAAKRLMYIQNPSKEFVFLSQQTDNLGFTHLKFQQTWKELSVFGAQVIAHADKDNNIVSLNGKFYESANLKNISPRTTKEDVFAKVKKDLSGKGITYKALNTWQLEQLEEAQEQAELIIFYQKNKPVLSWKVKIFPSFLDPYYYFVNAIDGTILDSYSDKCHIAGHIHSDKNDLNHKDLSEKENTVEELADGPTTGTGTDLNGVSRTFGTYQIGSSHYLIDVTKSMFDASKSTFPNKVVGGIITLDAGNTYPVNSDFKSNFITNTSTSWNNAKAISAHVNASKSYDYFLKTFNRKGLDGLGSSLVSNINVSDKSGTAMENAFYYNKVMYYGNGKNAFKPFSGSLDVAGHEMSHGVVEHTAGLIYKDEPGALNEHFADMFGAMIDREDWKLGEDIVKLAYYPTGAMRDMANPHNGGFSLSDDGWQPNNTAEQYTGTEDHGGVHINSGIPNFAYYKFANNSCVGKEKAELIWYRALSVYLTSSSEFNDLRVFTIKAAQELYANDACLLAALKTAFDQVGIYDNNPTPSPSDLAVNPGQEFIAYTDSDKMGLSVVTPSATYKFYKDSVYNRPSITDDGKIMLFVGAKEEIRYISFDWANLKYGEGILLKGRYHQVAISKDGNKIATTDAQQKDTVKIWTYNSVKKEWNYKKFHLYNPSTGVQLNNVKYADMIEWDYSGENLLYDALNTIGSGTNKKELWDVSFINVWDNQNNKFAEGDIVKLVDELPENVEIGNPAFSKNSPHIIAFDFIVTSSAVWKTAVIGCNLETGDLGEIRLDGTKDDLSFPSFNLKDNKVYYNDFGSLYNWIVTNSLQPNKINGTTPSTYTPQIVDAYWPIVFGTGTRSLIPPCQVQANFVASAKTASANEAITFTNTTTNITKQKWIFQGGTPATSTDKAPKVTYTKAGKYAVTLVTSNECGKDSLYQKDYIEVTAPALSATFTQKNISCNGAKDGSISIALVGGVAPFKYVWNIASLNTGTVNNLAAGTYKVIVTDAANNKWEKTIELTEPTAINATLTATDAICGKAVGAISITALSGGVPPYNYNWSNGDNNANQVNLSEGLYTLSITDKNACLLIRSGQVKSSASSLNIAATSSPMVEACEKTNVILLAAAAGGVTYVWSGAGLLQTTGSSVNATLGNGNNIFTIEVKDANGCTSKTTVSLLGIPLPQINAVASNVNPCLGDNISLIAIGADTYIWSSNISEGGLAATMGGNITAKPTKEGKIIYTVIGTSSKGCKSIPIALEVNVKNCGTATFDEKEDSDIIIYPNPFSEKIFFTKVEEIISIQVFDVLGKMILETNSITEGVDLQGFANELYIVKIYASDKKVFVKKIIKFTK
jgi:Zn-dependent metalloprotease/PKD repeat protein